MALPPSEPAPSEALTDARCPHRLVVVREGLRLMAWRHLLVLSAVAVLGACGGLPATATATPDFQRYRSAASVLAGWQQAGVPLSATTPVADTDGRAGAADAIAFAVPLAPGTAEGATGARAPSGRILVFSAPEALGDAEWFYRQLPITFPYVFRRHNVLVVLNRDVTAEQARQYQRAVERLP